PAEAAQRRGRGEPGVRRLARGRASRAAPLPSARAELSVRFAWLVSRYPTLSHSFIRREILELRRRGLTIDTFTLRRPPDAELLTESARGEARAPFAVLPAPPLALIAAHARALLRRPLATLRCLAAAFEGAAPNPKAWLWRLFHFAEAIRLAREL